MNICLVSQEYPPETAHGGIGSQTYLKAHGLAALGHEVHVISHSTDFALRTYQDGAVYVTRVPGFDEQMPIYAEPVRWLTYSTNVAVALSELCTHVSLDLVDFPEWGGEGYIHLLNQTEWNHIPTIVQLHGPMVMLAHTIGWPDMRSEFYRVGTMMEGTCLRLADAVYSSSRTSAGWCAKHYGLKCENIPVIHTGVDTHLFHPHDGPKHDRPTIIFVGRIAPSKGAELLLEAACRLVKNYPDLRLRMLGQGEESFMKGLHEKAIDSGFPDLLDLPGFTAREDLPYHLSRAHVFAAPSLYEGGPGFVYLEAMACGLPVIACEGSGAAEVVIHGKNGFCVPPGDLDQLVKVIRQLLDHPERLESMGAQAREYVLTEAESYKCIARLETFYLDVIAGENHS